MPKLSFPMPIGACIPWVRNNVAYELIKWEFMICAFFGKYLSEGLLFVFWIYFYYIKIIFQSL